MRIPSTPLGLNAPPPPTDLARWPPTVHANSHCASRCAPTSRKRRELIEWRMLPRYLSRLAGVWPAWPRVARVGTPTLAAHRVPRTTGPGSTHLQDVIPFDRAVRTGTLLTAQVLLVRTGASERVSLRRGEGGIAARERRPAWLAHPSSTWRSTGSAHFKPAIWVVLRFSGSAGPPCMLHGFDETVTCRSPTETGDRR